MVVFRQIEPGNIVFDFLDRKESLFRQEKLFFKKIQKIEIFQ